MPSKSLRSDARRIQVRRSGVHGKGVFALQDIGEGETIVEYKGEVISWDEAQDRHPHDPSDPNHTFYFHVNADRVIDGGVNGNSARWINHSCDGNCEADERDGRIFIVALRNIEAGEELNYDYGLIIEERYTPKLKAEYSCWCGNKNCRGTLLAPKRGWAPPVPVPPSKAIVKPKPAKTPKTAKATKSAPDKAPAKASQKPAQPLKPLKSSKATKAAKALKKGRSQ